MSTGKKNTTQYRFVKLARMNEIIFHSADLANIWNIKNKNTLYTTLTRYVKQGLIFRIYRGLYSIKPIEQLDPYLLGLKAMHKYCYISTETVLAQAGIMQQKMDYITLIGSKSKRFLIGNYNYYCRQLDDKFLFQYAGIIKKDGINIATTERAIADLLYFNKNAYFDAKDKIDWKKVNKIQKILGYDYDSAKSKRRYS
ncbi:MAG: hypothetical protein ABID45_04390 [Patescibacteria group bacterium]